MKKTIIALVLFSMLILVTSCTAQDTHQASEHPAPAETTSQESPLPSPTDVEPNPTPNTNLEGEVIPSQPNNSFGEGGYGDFEELFIEPVNLIGNVLERAVGWDAIHEYIRDVWEPNRAENLKLPLTYSAKQYFGISKEDFIKYNNENIAMGFELTYADWMIEALYCGDEEEMVRLLLAPTTLYADGELFNMWEAASMSEAERDALGLTSDEWDEYVESVEEALGDGAIYYQDALEMLKDPNYKPDWDDEWVED